MRKTLKNSTGLNYAVYLTLKSGNGKVGPIPVSTISDNTCPTACPFNHLNEGGCYADTGPVALIWKTLSAHKPGESWSNSRGYHFQSLTWDEYCDAVARFPQGQPWRHGQAGDLPGIGDAIDAKALRQLVKANKGKRGWTYTHKPVLNNAANRRAIAHANNHGFTINLSANHVAEVDSLVALNIAPVAVVLPASVHGKQDIATAEGTRIVVCPATYMDTNCADCLLCEKRDRKVAVGFPAHGVHAKKANAIASQTRVVINYSNRSS